jgi:hypothetical protein
MLTRTAIGAKMTTICLQSHSRVCLERELTLGVRTAFSGKFNSLFTCSRRVAREQGALFSALHSNPCKGECMGMPTAHWYLSFHSIEGGVIECDKFEVLLKSGGKHIQRMILTGTECSQNA